VARAAATAIVLTGCQILGGIGDIEQGAADAIAPFEASGRHDASADATFGSRDSGHGYHYDGGEFHFDSHFRDDHGFTGGMDTSTPPVETGLGDSGADSPMTSGGTPNPCFIGATCVLSGTTVDASATCADGGFVTCGGLDQACCPAGVANPGASAFCQPEDSTHNTLTCAGGQCVECGLINGPCCPASGPSGVNGVCADDEDNPTSCLQGMCQPCGEIGQPCCTNDADAEGPNGCTDEGDPATCGTEGECATCACSDEECCTSAGACVESGQACGGGGTCDDSECESDGPPCGLLSEACCGGTVCLDGSLCLGGMCSACGAADEPCCADAAGGGSCGGGLICRTNMCIACGQPTEPCCIGDTCTSGLCDVSTGYCNTSTMCGG
jgi:hypothetical protein